MIITRTPFRISFFGGGTDYPAYYREHGGLVLSTTINKYCYVTCSYLPPFFDYTYRIRYSRKEETTSIEEIQHPSVRECLKFAGIQKGIEMVHTSDIPAMSGIGSSSAFTVGFLLALQSLKGVMVTKRKLAYDAVHVEQNLIGENVGSQDQTAAAFGGLNKIEFGCDDSIFVQPVTIKEDLLKYLQSCLLFYFTGFSRSASEVAAEQIRQTPNKLSELHSMRQMVDAALEILSGPVESVNDFGKLLHESWLLKRSLTHKISNDRIDSIYKAGIEAGALGGKICGAGGGGFILFFVEPEYQARVKQALANLLQVPFRFENLGSHVIHYSDSAW
jgi:D-glycero-alpha-D-manno-heptose-7-phosphate kinase